ncbi:hypothetical protein SISNIDRAFT_418873 [Sistotremastrum niveocremeum HHB9708]|uniref:Integrase core domain-containing protein n=1 Tax=Sistotremastrum niveocremeum HHB9708 TaxID=1314777 RepID=A0A164NQ91_9AGAM|nr:hypothetical protein SISNIDRAFT_418873 [Sistotremastrum niveocremeum HHB9708]
MKAIHPEGFILRHPDFRTTKIHNGKVITIGPGERWGVDGHEKLTLIGFSIYGIRDAWGKILRFQVVPNARNEQIVDYVFLLTVQEAGGVPLTVTSDKGTETGGIFARQTSLRALFAPEIDPDVLPAYISIRSVRNIIIERSWSVLLKKVGRNLKAMWEQSVVTAGFVEGNVLHRALADWIWVPLAQDYINDFVNTYNNHKVRRQPHKQGPSNAAHNYTYQFPEEFGGENQLVYGDMDLVAQILQDHPGKEAIRFYPPWFDVLCQESHRRIGRPPLTLASAWLVFVHMLVPVSVAVSALGEGGLRELVREVEPADREEYY